MSSFQPTGKTYSGPLEVGEDLMVVAVGEKVEGRQQQSKVLSYED